MEKTPLIKRITKYSQSTFILYGVVFWVPVALVVYIGLFFFGDAEKIGRAILGIFVPDKYLFFGMGAVLFLLMIYLTGVVLKLTSLGRMLSKVPLIGLFFSQGEIMTIGRLAHMQPCLFLFSPTCLSYGWVLSHEKVKLSTHPALFPIINVYHANTPTLVMGQVFATRKDAVMLLSNPSRDIINLLLYAFRSPAALEYIPWEDETEENFRERSKYFGLKLDTGKNPELDATEMGTDQSPPK
jgi:hypothetical protein